MLGKAIKISELQRSNLGLHSAQQLKSLGAIRAYWRLLDKTQKEKGKSVLEFELSRNHWPGMLAKDSDQELLLRKCCYGVANRNS